MLCVPRGIDSSALMGGGRWQLRKQRPAGPTGPVTCGHLNFLVLASTTPIRKPLRLCAHSWIPSNKPLPVGYMHDIVRISTEKERLPLVVLSSTIRAPHSESLEQRTTTATPATTSTASTNRSGIDTCTATRKPSGPSSPSRRTGPTPPAHSSPCLSSWSRWW